MADPEEIPIEAPPDVAEILHAYDYGDYLGLIILPTGASEPEPFALYLNDPYGLAPRLRVQLERMMADGEISIEQPPPDGPFTPVEPVPIET